MCTSQGHTPRLSPLLGARASVVIFFARVVEHNQRRRAQSSNIYGLRYLAEAAAIIAPTLVEPMKFMRRSFRIR